MTEKQDKAKIKRLFRALESIEKAARYMADGYSIDEDAAKDFLRKLADQIHNRLEKERE